jgi:hypothetical protein
MVFRTVSAFLKYVSTKKTFQVIRSNITTIQGLHTSLTTSYLRLLNRISSICTNVLLQDHVTSALTPDMQPITALNVANHNPTVLWLLLFASNPTNFCIKCLAQKYIKSIKSGKCILLLYSIVSLVTEIKAYIYCT